MGDDITIGVTEIVNNIEVTAQPNDQVVDINVTDNTDEVTLNITPTVVEININKGASYARWGTIYGTLTDQTDLANALLLKADLVEGKVPSYQLPSYVDDIVEVANYAALPVAGETGKIYVTLDNNKIYRWSGSVYIEIAANNAIWGSITGTLSSQTDLQTALDTKALKTTTISTSAPLTGGGSLAENRTISISQSGVSSDGYLSSTDWNTFNGKQSALTGSGIVKSTSGTISYLTDNSANWDAAYNDKINSAAVTGTTTKTLTLTQQDGGTLIASWSDIGDSLIFSSPLVNTSGTISIPAASGSVNGYLSSTDWTTFNNKEGAITAGTTSQYYRGDKTFQTLNTSVVPESTNLYYTESRVSANTDVTANTAARHNAVTIGTANGLSLSTQQLSLALASASATGALSSTDWNTFNGKQSVLTFSSPLINTSGTITIQAASGSTNGYLSSADWITFNNKQSALSGTGFVKISGSTISYDNSTYALDNSVVKLTTNQVIQGKKEFNLVYSGLNLSLITSDISSGGNNGMLRLYDNTTFNDLFVVESDGAVFAKSFIKSGGTSSQYLMADGSVSTGGSGGISGTTNYIPKFTGTNTIGNSSIYEDATGVGVGTTSPRTIFSVYNNADIWHTIIGGASGELRIGGQTSSGAVIQAYTPAGVVRDIFLQRDGGKLLIGASNVGIGNVADAGYKLDVNGSGRFKGTAGNASAFFNFETTSANNTFNWVSTAFASNLTAGNNLIHFIGQAGSSKNAAYLGFKYAGSGSNDNILTLGLFAVDNVLNINGAGNVLINTTTDSGYKLDVNGTGRFSSYLDINYQASAANGSLNIDSADPTIRFRVLGGTANKRIYELRAIAAGGTNDRLELRTWNDAQNAASSLLSVTNSGSVGIGTTSPTGQSSDNRVIQIYGAGTGQRAQIHFVNASTGEGTSDGTFIGVDSSKDFYLNNTEGATVFENGGSERMRIFSNGQVQISSPISDAFKLINSNSSAYNGIILQNDVASQVVLGTGGSTVGGANQNRGYSGTVSNIDYYLMTNNTDRMRIFANGNIGINNTTDAGYKLDINGKTRVFVASASSDSPTLMLNQAGLYANIAGAGDMYHGMIFRGIPANYTDYAVTAGDYMSFYEYGGDFRFYKKNVSQLTQLAIINSTGITATGFFNSSDIRLKDLTDYDYNVSDIKPITYLWKDGRDNKKHVGYSAQEVQKVMPDAVNEDEKGILSVNYIEVLVAKIAELESRIKKLEK